MEPLEGASHAIPEATAEAAVILPPAAVATSRVPMPPSSIDQGQVGGHFWALAEEDDRSSSEEDETSVGNGDDYLAVCRTPSIVGG